MCILQCSVIMPAALFWAMAMLRQCQSKEHCCDMMLTGAGWANQKQNLITITPGNLTLASNIIPRPKLAHILINFKNTNILPQSLPQDTFSQSSLFFHLQEVEISRERVLSHLDKVFLTSFFGITAWVTHQSDSTVGSDTQFVHYDMCLALIPRYGRWVKMHYMFYSEETAQ